MTHASPPNRVLVLFNLRASLEAQQSALNTAFDAPEDHLFRQLMSVQLEQLILQASVALDTYSIGLSPDQLPADPSFHDYLKGSLE